MQNGFAQGTLNLNWVLDWTQIDLLGTIAARNTLCGDLAQLAASLMTKKPFASGIQYMPRYRMLPISKSRAYTGGILS